MMDVILERLVNPDNKYRCIPFWSWNGDLDPEEVRRQVRDMAESGFGGYFIHARAGLKTPYFGESWMACIDACIDEGRKQGIKTWLYDENGYPSGFSGGIVPAAGLAFQQKHLDFEVMKAGGAVAPKGSSGMNPTVPGTGLPEASQDRSIPSEDPSDQTCLAFYRTSGSFERVNPIELNEDEMVLRVSYTVNPYYSDMLNPAAVKAFIDTTYEPYYARFGAYFGKEIPGIFTDEPQYGRKGFPWSDALPGKFREMHGRDLLDCLSALHFKSPEHHEIRHSFWSTVTDLFVNGCSKQLADWCESHQCSLTGHVLLEEDMRFQTLCSGSAMAFYRHMQIPGIDWLGKATGTPVSLKQVVSAALQSGRELILSEMFAAAGWNTTLAELKHIAEWQYVLGINLTCAHLYAYTLSGMRKKDHPPGLSHQSNWWAASRSFNDYFARLGQLLSEGEPGEQLLVIHPLRSGWISMDTACNEKAVNAEMSFLDASFEKLSKKLSGMHVDYHFGDEGMISEMGEVEENVFRIGKCRYKSVLIPQARTLEPHTARLLEQYAQAGGKLFCLDEFPTMINGVPAEDLKWLRDQCVLLDLDISTDLSLTAMGCNPVSVAEVHGGEAEAIYHNVRLYGEKAVLFLVNMDEKDSHSVHVELYGYLPSCSLDLQSCTSSNQSLSSAADGRMPLHFEPAQSHILVFDKVAASSIPDKGTFVPTLEREPDLSICSAKPEAAQILRMDNKWVLRDRTPNVLVLDVCKYSVEGGAWSPLLPVTQVQKELLLLGRSVSVALSFAFEVRNLPVESSEMHLAVELAGSFELSINGSKVPTTGCTWWKDKSFGKMSIREHVRAGVNRIELQTVFRNSEAVMEKVKRAEKFEAEMNMLTYLSEFENIYLLGDFGVYSDTPALPGNEDSMTHTGPFWIGLPPGETGTNLTTAGFPFFTGSVLLEQAFRVEEGMRFDSVKMALNPHCAYSRLYINGVPVRTILWSPYETEIGDYVKEGINRIGLELFSTDRNLFGPHHHPDGELRQLGPKQFSNADGWLETYNLVQFGVGEEVSVRIHAQ